MGEPRQLGGADLAEIRERLVARGIDPSVLDAPSESPVGKGESPEDRRARLQRQADNRAARWRRRLPVIYAEAGLADLDGPVRDALVEWSQDPAPRTLILVGGTGTGKTYAAYALGREAVAHQRWVEAWNVVDLMHALRPGGDETTFDHVSACDLLILDDLAQVKTSDWAVEQMYRIVDARVNAALPTVVTTNQSATTLGEMWGAATLDRILFRARIVKMTGQSRRQAAF
jgi:hypothetical protein